MKTTALTLSGLSLIVLATSPLMAQQITGTPGSPSAPTTIDGNYIPNPPPAFGGEINLNAKDSKTWWPPNIVPPKGAPNILLIMTDDQGYGISGTFGGVIPTPTMDRIAKMGLRYTEFHSTSLCSPSRAAIITGRNHHSVGFGVIAEQATGYPGYNSIIGVDNATIGEILKENGYATSWFEPQHGECRPRRWWSFRWRRSFWRWRPLWWRPHVRRPLWGRPHGWRSLCWRRLAWRPHGPRPLCWRGLAWRRPSRCLEWWS